jgi:hypothetical protein
MHNFSFLFALLLLSSLTQAQELDVDFSISTAQLQRTDPKLIENLEQDINEFINNQSFTNDTYENFEKIKVNMQLNIKNESGENTFDGELVIQAIRPVFGSEYETVLLTHVDPYVKFEYTPSLPIQHAENGFVNNLSSILSYYAFVILGYDADSFSPTGGEDFFIKAQNQMNAVPSNLSSGDSGWQSTANDKNRYWLIENMLSPKMKDFRNALYNYHRHGLDMMHSDVAEGHQTIGAALDVIKNARNNYPNAMVFQIFINSKAEEVLEIMVQAPRSHKSLAYNSLVSLDPSNRSKYNRLR